MLQVKSIFNVAQWQQQNITTVKKPGGLRRMLNPFIITANTISPLHKDAGNRKSQGNWSGEKAICHAVPCTCSYGARVRRRRKVRQELFRFLHDENVLKGPCQHSFHDLHAVFHCSMLCLRTLSNGRSRQLLLHSLYKAGISCQYCTSALCIKVKKAE